MLDKLYYQVRAPEGRPCGLTKDGEQIKGSCFRANKKRHLASSAESNTRPVPYGSGGVIRSRAVALLLQHGVPNAHEQPRARRQAREGKKVERFPGKNRSSGDSSVGLRACVAECVAPPRRFSLVLPRSGAASVVLHARSWSCWQLRLG